MRSRFTQRAQQIIDPRQITDQQPLAKPQPPSGLVDRLRSEVIGTGSVIVTSTRGTGASAVCSVSATTSGERPSAGTD